MIPTLSHMLALVSGALAPREFAGSLPDDPVRTLREWFSDAEASGRYHDPGAMSLATSSPDGAPSSRMVLCKAIESDPPALLFFSSYQSRKGRELSANPRAAAVFHWPHARRQARVEGTVERISSPESDAYFAGRPLLARLGAQASAQGAALESRAELISRVVAAARVAARRGRVVRPESWGGYRLHIVRLELWVGAAGRLHDRILWTRASQADDRSASRTTPGTRGWRAQRLCP